MSHSQSGLYSMSCSAAVNNILLLLQSSSCPLPANAKTKIFKMEMYWREPLFWKSLTWGFETYKALNKRHLQKIWQLNQVYHTENCTMLVHTVSWCYQVLPFPAWSQISSWKMASPSPWYLPLCGWLWVCRIFALSSQRSMLGLTPEACVLRCANRD